jgi:SAM-dependent methyltransferase
MRAAIQIFEQECFSHKLNHIYVTEQSTPLFQAMQVRYPNLNGSEYLGDKLPFGTTDSKGIRNESIVNLTFPTNTFDHILSFDVLEHVPDYKQGFLECLRCLKSGGSLLFTVPFTAKPDTLVRARKNSDGTISHLLPPEYHGDPLNTQGCLCFYHFGWDLLDELGNLGFQDTLALVYWSRELGYLGNGSQIIFKAQKLL